VRNGGIDFQKPREQHGGDVGSTHRQAGMAGFRLLDRVHGECADGVCHAVVLGARHRSHCAFVGGFVRNRGGGGFGRRHAHLPMAPAGAGLAP
jgi:hypothetical protein